MTNHLASVSTILLRANNDCRALDCLTVQRWLSPDSAAPDAAVAAEYRWDVATMNDVGPLNFSVSVYNLPSRCA